MAKDKFEQLEKNIKAHITGEIKVVNTKIDNVNTFIIDQKITNKELHSKTNSNAVKIEKVKSSLSIAKIFVTIIIAALSVALVFIKLIT